MNKLKRQTWNLIIFLLLAFNTVMLSSYFYKKFHHEKLSVEILNGCGETGVAAKLAERLTGYHIIGVENAEAFNFEKTVLYTKCKKTNKDLKKLCAVIGISQNRIIYEVNEQKLANVSIIVGKDYSSLHIFKTVPLQ